MWKALMDVWYKIWGQKRDSGCGCNDFENIDGCPCPPKSKKKKKKMTGVCSAHKYGEDPNCPICYPETIFIKKKKIRMASDGKPMITRDRFEKLEKEVTILKKKRKPRAKKVK